MCIRDRWEIVQQAQEIDPMTGQPMMGPDGQPIISVAARKVTIGKVVIEVVPPEEYGYSRRSPNSDEADYQYRRQAVFAADLKRMFPDLADDIDRVAGNGLNQVIESDPRWASRFGNANGFGLNQYHDAQKRVWLRKENIRIDFDGDGFVELRRVWRVGDVMLVNDVIDISDFASWSPLRIPHRQAGLGIFDQVGYIQNITTELARRGLDSVDRATFPRTFVNEQAAGDDTIDAILANDDVITVRGDPRSVVQQEVVPDLSAAAVNGIEYFRGMASRSTGVGQETQALDPKTIAKAQSGVAVDLIQTAASARKEMIARMAARGFEGIFKRALKLVIAHQDVPRQMMINGKPLLFDPSRWDDEMAIRVHVGMGAANRATQLANINLIAAKQEQIIMQAGPDNPIAPIDKLRNTYAEMVRAMGYRDETRYFGEIPPTDPNAPKPPPPPDPKLVEVQEAAKLKEMAAESDSNVADRRLDAEIKRKDRELDADLARQERQLAAEIDLKRRQLLGELELEKEMLKRNPKAANGAAVNGGGVHFGGDPG